MTLCAVALWPDAQPVSELTIKSEAAKLCRGTCPTTETDFCRDYNWASKYYNYAVPVTELVSKVTEAMELWTQINRGSRQFVRYPRDQLQHGHHQLN